MPSLGLAARLDGSILSRNCSRLPPAAKYLLSIFLSIHGNISPLAYFVVIAILNAAFSSGERCIALFLHQRCARKLFVLSSASIWISGTYLRKMVFILVEVIAKIKISQFLKTHKRIHSCCPKFALSTHVDCIYRKAKKPPTFAGGFVARRGIEPLFLE
jgi:hypothetical protein